MKKSQQTAIAKARKLHAMQKMKKISLFLRAAWCIFTNLSLRRCVLFCVLSLFVCLYVILFLFVCLFVVVVVVVVVVSI